MIKVTIKRSSNEEIHSFSLSGHANFAKHGSDIVCAGVSAVVFGSINSVLSLTKVNLHIDQASDGGYLHCTVSNDANKQELSKAQLLFEGMLVSLQTIEQDYKQYVKIINI